MCPGPARKEIPLVGVDILDVRRPWPSGPIGNGVFKNRESPLPKRKMVAGFFLTITTPSSPKPIPGILKGEIYNGVFRIKSPARFSFFAGDHPSRPDRLWAPSPMRLSCREWKTRRGDSNWVQQPAPTRPNLLVFAGLSGSEPRCWQALAESQEQRHPWEKL